MKGRGTASLVVATLAVAACSITYELLLAQCVATLYGNTVLRYSVTIGLYLFALGMGALAAGRWRVVGDMETLRALVRLEMTLAVCGAASPLVAFGVEALASTGVIPGAATFAAVHAWIILIGLLSGLEVPLLLRVARADGADAAASGAAILAADFAGTCLGALAFPLVLYPALGLIAGAAVTGLVNFAAAAAIAVGCGARAVLQRERALAFGVAAALAVVVVLEAPLRAALGRVLFGTMVF